jgi:DNA-binding response OmpR family regulator
MRLLVVEDQPDIARLVSAGISRAGYVVDMVATVEEALAAVKLARYSLVLLDRRLPDGDGITLLAALRAAQQGIAVIILTALDSVPDRVFGLEAGADDYITKPFEADELLARVRAALRRPGADIPPPIICNDLSFDPTTRDVTVRGIPLALKRRELAVLAVLMRRMGRVVLRETLLDEVYSFDDAVNSNTLDAHISRLRLQLRRSRVAVRIHAIRGVGYMLDRA